MLSLKEGLPRSKHKGARVKSPKYDGFNSEFILKPASQEVVEGKSDTWDLCKVTYLSDLLLPQLWSWVTDSTYFIGYVLGVNALLYEKLWDNCWNVEMLNSASYYYYYATWHITQIPSFQLLSWFEQERNGLKMIWADLPNCSKRWEMRPEDHPPNNPTQNHPETCPQATLLPAHQLWRLYGTQHCLLQPPRP